MRPLCTALLALLLAGCRPSAREAPLFTLVPAAESGVAFENRLTERDGLNVLDYEYFYNGGGVAVGDVDGDGLPDLFFTANMGPNALYLNRGGFRFEDVTARAGVAGGPGWKTGVTMADVNGDGRLDLYVCKSGAVQEALRRNELYVNNGDGTFTEQAAAYGVDDPGYATHATFFDYDRDGDLDLFVVNHNIRRMKRFVVDIVRRMRDPLAGDKLFRNDPGSGSGTGPAPGGGRRFTDVSAEAGILANPIGFGLSATAADVDGDGWTDLYVANDYVEDDYLYLNNGDGTFSERLRDVLTHTSYSSMGSDIADVDNDARPDVLTLDMLPASFERQKLLYGPVDIEEYRNMLENGYHHQVTRNMLHLNNGVGPFSEIGQLAGIEATDWSWAPLLADFDNDGFKDLFVTTGYLRDYTNMDYWEHDLPAYVQQAEARGERPPVLELVRRMPSSEYRSHFFRNRGDLTFEPVSARWGIDRPSFSNGAAYADLDADGDLDLVVNNVNAPAFLYRNGAERMGRHYLKVRLEGEAPNPFGVGARVTVTTADGRTLYQEAIPARGYQSSVEPVLLFGLGAAASADLAVAWPDGRRQALRGVAADRLVAVRQQEAVAPGPADARADTLHADTTRFAPLPGALGLAFVHREDAPLDFTREPLLPHLLSRRGPALAQGDVNGDGLADVFVGGAHGQAPALFLQQADGTFRPVPTPALDAHADREDVDAAFFDADGDRDLDLYVVSGGGAETTDSTAFQDRLYVNTGFGVFAYRADALPPMPVSGGTVAPADYDGDGDADLFVGGRAVPGRYPYAPRSYLLENVGGRFVDATERAGEALLRPGLVADAAWADLDGDRRLDLVLAGEWMPVRVFRNEGGGAFREVTERAGLARSGGWWNAVQAADLDGDGDQDLVAGNRGLNGPLRASAEAPVTMHAADFDGNGTVDPIVSAYQEGVSYPVALRNDLLAQLPGLKARFPTYASYARVTTDALLPAGERRRALVLHAHTFATTLFENRGDGTFAARALPTAAQFAPVTSILVRDFDHDGQADLLLAGNDFGTPLQQGRDGAGRGLFLHGRPGLAFVPYGPAASGFLAAGDVRRLVLLPTRRGPVVVVAQNDAPLAAFAVR